MMSYTLFFCSNINSYIFLQLDNLHKKTTGVSAFINSRYSCYFLMRNSSYIKNFNTNIADKIYIPILNLRKFPQQTFSNT